MNKIERKIKQLLRTKSDKAICFRNKSNLYLESRLLNPLASDAEIKLITDDLLNDEHPCLKKKLPLTYIPTYAWTDKWSVKTNLKGLLMDSPDYPQYFIDKALERSQRELLTESSWNKSHWHKNFELITFQNNISPKTLLDYVIWVGKNIPESPDGMWTINLEIDPDELMSLALNHKNFDPRNLIILCSNSNPLIRDLASEHPLCPPEGLVAIALMRLSDR